jgi:hypothetical protein
MEDVPSEPCGWHCRNGPLRRADDFVPAALWFADHGPWPTQILWFGIIAHTTADWIANQLTEACGWEQIPRYLIWDRDRAFAEIVVRRGLVDRHSRPPDGFLLTLAKRVRRTVDRLNPEGMHRSCRSI